MANPITIRYGRNYKVVLAIIMPGLLTWPFIEVMQLVKPMEEWLVFVVIFAFLGCIIGLTLWLVSAIYPIATLTISDKEIHFAFNNYNPISPADFTLQIKDITAFSYGEMGGTGSLPDEYVRIETKTFPRKFQISANSRSVEDYLAFNEAIVKIGELVNNLSADNPAG